MDLVQTVRKEGSRGGRADFKWEDVKQDTQRENYLGHSVMAPVGRWQQGRDLSWYARGDNDDEQTAAEKLAEEKSKLKEAEEDAMLVAMGLPVPNRPTANANLTPLGERAQEQHVDMATEERAHDDDPKKESKDRLRKDRRDRRDDEKRRRRRRHDRSRSDEGRRDRSGNRQRHRSRSREHRRRDDRQVRHRDSQSGHERRRSRSRERHHRRRSRSPYNRHEKRRD